MSEVKAEIITIGDEILIGQIIDTNSQWISAELDLLGIKTHKKTSIRDEAQAIKEELRAALQRSDIIIMTGGLGPTKDDITKKTIADFFGVDLIQKQEVLEHISSMYEKRNRKLNENNIGQSYIPSNATYLMNNWGTAPGMWFKEKNSILVSLPGVPVEMKNLIKGEVIPRLKKEFKTPIIRHRVIRTIGIGESDMMSIIEEWEDSLPQNIKLAYLPRLGQVRLRLSGFGTDIKQLDHELETQIELLKPLLAKFIYGYGEIELEEALKDLLIDNNLSLATAESCTGGNIAHKITSVPGSSAYFKGGIVSYSNDIKIEQLNVDPESIKNYGAVSEEVVSQMAKNVRQIYKTDFGLASSGIAGPEGGSKEKPVGTIWLALADSQGVIAKKIQLGFDREMNIEWSTLYVLNLLRKRIRGWV